MVVLRSAYISFYVTVFIVNVVYNKYARVFSNYDNLLESNEVEIQD